MDENVIFNDFNNNNKKEKCFIWNKIFCVYKIYIFSLPLDCIERPNGSSEFLWIAVRLYRILQRTIFTGSGNGTRKQEQTKVLIVSLICFFNLNTAAIVMANFSFSFSCYQFITIYFVLYHRLIYRHWIIRTSTRPSFDLRSPSTRTIAYDSRIYKREGEGVL